MSTLHIFEGPAGSGKSTLIEKTAKYFKSPVVSIKRSDTLRDFGESAPESSFLKDNEAAVQAAILLHRGNENVLMDRYFLSQVVYESIRKYPGQFYTFDRRRLVNSMSYALGKLERNFREMHSRSFPLVLSPQPGQILPEHTSYQTVLHILLPSKAKLESNRSKSGKEYPFSVEEELHYYRQFSTLSAMFSGVVMTFHTGDDPFSEVWKWFIED